MNPFACRCSDGYPYRAGVAGKHCYVVSIHAPSPVDAQEETANRAQTVAPASDRAMPGNFQAPAGFVLKGAARHNFLRLSNSLCLRCFSNFQGNDASQAVLFLLLTFLKLPSGLHRTVKGYLVTLFADMMTSRTTQHMSAGTAGRGGPIGPGKLPRRGDLGDIQYILQEVLHPSQPFRFHCQASCSTAAGHMTDMTDAPCQP